MLKGFQWREPVRIARLVDERGQVFCPLLARDVDVERCLACPTRGDLTRHGDGAVTSVICRPSLGSLVAAGV